MSFNIRARFHSIVHYVSRNGKELPNPEAVRQEIKDIGDLRVILANKDPLRVLLLLDASQIPIVVQLLQTEAQTAEGAKYRKLCVKCMQKLVKKHHILPPSLFVKNVVRQGDHPICGGGFSDIWKGKMAGEHVCLKVLRMHILGDSFQRQKVLKKFCEEALLWTQLNHANIVPLFGVNTALFSPGFCLISPWYSNENIISYLKKNPEHDRLSAIYDIAAGLAYLHSHVPAIVHGDIKGANILVDNDLCCRLADFGLAAMTSESEQLFSSTTTGGPKGSFRWMAPELFKTGDESPHFKGSSKSSRDMYAYGCTVLEIITGKAPFPNLLDPQVMLLVLSGKRPERPVDGWCPDNIWDVIERCWHTNPAHRPSAAVIHVFLEQLLASRQANDIDVDQMFLPQWDLVSEEEESPVSPFDSGPSFEDYRFYQEKTSIQASGSLPWVDMTATSHTGDDERGISLPTSTPGHTPESGASFGLVSPNPSEDPPPAYGEIGTEEPGSGNLQRWQSDQKVDPDAQTAPTPNPEGSMVSRPDDERARTRAASDNRQAIQSRPELPSYSSQPAREEPQDYRGWLSKVVQPLDEFIDPVDNPRDHYYDLQMITEDASGAVFSARVNMESNSRLRLSSRVAKQKLVAIKCIPVTPSWSGMLEQLRNELRVLEGISHSNIQRIDALYVDSSEDCLWVRRELMTYRLSDVVEFIEKHLLIGEVLIATLIKDLLRAMVFLRSHDIAHCNIRPESLWLNSDGVLKLGSFSGSKKAAVATALTLPVSGIDSREYWQAPETAGSFGHYDPFKADVWSLGAVSWVLVRKNPSFYSVRLQGFLQLCWENPETRPDVNTLTKHHFCSLYSSSAFRRGNLMRLLDSTLASRKSSHDHATGANASAIPPPITTSRSLPIVPTQTGTLPTLTISPVDTPFDAELSPESTMLNPRVPLRHTVSASASPI
ncbi:hypothetical protein Moror_8183 [Moniliophthora roreri MCA 2997]|uniref:Protein kinase domain-containing protein n=2 Tax=Moniliophthora roreri TaxID=221103 RepID=V2X583_MONRO|nr:hypothetical protein Moror_8183 [Moniliophthora roreri MCA 2997]KAI3606354.1 hypothetical protein WG66_009593 [Moniliophthora roreri]